MRPIIHCPKHGISPTQKQWGTGSSVCARCVDEEMTSFAMQSTSDVSKRSQILETAKQYITKDRNASHGEPEDTFSAISGMWSAYLGVDVEPHDVCAMMALLKVGRIKANPGNDDNWIDLAGYAACGAEVAK